MNPLLLKVAIGGVGGLYLWHAYVQHKVTAPLTVQPKGSNNTPLTVGNSSNSPQAGGQYQTFDQTGAISYGLTGVQAGDFVDAATQAAQTAAQQKGLNVSTAFTGSTGTVKTSKTYVSKISDAEFAKWNQAPNLAAKYAWAAYGRTASGTSIATDMRLAPQRYGFSDSQAAANWINTTDTQTLQGKYDPATGHYGQAQLKLGAWGWRDTGSTLP